MNRVWFQEIISSGVFFGAISFILLFLSSDKGFSPAEVASLMFICSFWARGSRVLLAPILDKISIRLNFCLFHLSGAVGYLGLIYAKSFLESSIAVVLIGFFFAGSNLLIRVLIPDLNKGEVLNKTFAKLHVVTNIAAGLAPLVMNLLFDYNMTFSFLVISVLLGVSSVISFIMMKNLKLSVQKPFFKSFIKLLLDFKLYKLYFFTITLWLIYAQIFSLAPILLKQSYGLQNLIWIIGALNGVMIVAFSVKINGYLSKLFSNYKLLFFTLISSLIGFGVILFIPNIGALFVGIFIITLAEIIFIPALQSTYSASVPSEQRVASFAINACLIGLAQGLGFYIGTFIGLAA